MAADAAATFYEMVLMDTRENAIARFHARADDRGLEAHHREAVAMTPGGDEELGEMYDRLVALVALRPGAHVVRTVAGEPEAAYRAVTGLLDADR